MPKIVATLFDINMKHVADVSLKRKSLCVKSKMYREVPMNDFSMVEDDLKEYKSVDVTFEFFCIREDGNYIYIERKVDHVGSC